MEEYTNGPFKVGLTIGGHATIESPNDKRYAVAVFQHRGPVSHRDARRLAACLNACEGVKTIALEQLANSGGLPRIFSERAEYSEMAGVLERQRDQLLAALEDLLDEAPPLWEASERAAAAIAAVKGEKPADDRSVIEEFVAVWFEATEEWVAVLPNGHVLRGKWGAVGYAVNAALEYLGRGEAEFDVLDLGGDGPTFRYVKNDEYWQEGGAPC